MSGHANLCVTGEAGEGKERAGGTRAKAEYLNIC